VQRYLRRAHQRCGIPLLHWCHQFLLIKYDSISFPAYDRKFLSRRILVVLFRTQNAISPSRPTTAWYTSASLASKNSLYKVSWKFFLPLRSAISFSRNNRKLVSGCIQRFQHCAHQQRGIPPRRWRPTLELCPGCSSRFFPCDRHFLYRGITENPFPAACSGVPIALTHDVV
jgi:hypothetical protein